MWNQLETDFKSVKVGSSFAKIKKKKIVKGNKENCLRKNRPVSQPGLSGGHPKGNVRGK